MKNAISIRKRKPAAVLVAANDADFLFGIKELKDSSPAIYDHIKRQIDKSGANIVIAIPAHRICPSGWYNRHPDSYKNKKFEDLKNYIQSSGVNSQPIIVRLRSPSINEIGFANGDPDEPLFEIISGHLMYQACRELGISVRAIVIPQIEDKELIRVMHDENRSRPDFSPFEAGVMYKQWIDKSLYLNQAEISRFIGRKTSDVSRCLALAKLDSDLIAAFESPLVFQLKDADKLNQLLSVSKCAVLKRANELAELPEKKSRAEVLSLLKEAAFGVDVGSTNKKRIGSVYREGNLIGQWEWDVDGRGKFTLNQPMQPIDQERIEQTMIEVLGRQKQKGLIWMFLKFAGQLVNRR